jgi:predicted nucleic acid-binding protein
MDKIVSNATPLIYLAKANQLSLLKSMVKQVLIPYAVYREVVLEGKRLGETDAYRVEKAITDDWILVQDVTLIYPVEITIHPGEIEVISLAKETGIKRVLVDDSKARAACEMAGLKPVGTLWLILRAVEKRVLNFDDFLSTLEDIIRAGFYLNEEVYLRAVHKARKLTGSTDYAD